MLSFTNSEGRELPSAGTQLTISHYRFVCEAIMRVLSTVAIAMFSVSVGMHVNPAAAQSFEERFSIIPKANAAEPNGQIRQAPEKPPGEAEPKRRAEDRRAMPSVRRSFTGKASYYSYQRGKTASGALFNRNFLTAAHRSLPFGTKVRVTHLATSKSVTVTITDRGPWVRGRMLDLSLAAARTLGITDRGVAHVRAEVL
jgi:rare lipoprotein A